MPSRDVSLPVAAAVFVGAAILFGAPITLVLLTIVEILLTMAEISVPAGPTLVGNAVAFGAIVATLWLWLQISYEITAVRLYGFDALRRGSRPAIAARHLLFGGLAATALSVVTLFGFLGVIGGGATLAGLFGLALTVACLAVLVRAGRAFWAGLTAPDRP